MVPEENDKPKTFPLPDPFSLPDRHVRFPQSYMTCPKHGITYPRGSICPQCASEKKSDLYFGGSNPVASITQLLVSGRSSVRFGYPAPACLGLFLRACSDAGLFV